jgi:hypothetical protein
LTPEGKVKAVIKSVLARHGEHVYIHMSVPTGYGRSTLDYLGCAYGWGFAIEAKRPGRKPTIRQERVIEEMLKAGMEVFVIDGPDGVEHLEQWLTTRSGL